MSIDDTDVERYLGVGNAAVFYVEPKRKQKIRYKTVIRGWTKGKIISFDRPCEMSGTYVSLREGMNCGIRFIAEGTACSFEANVLEWDQRSRTPCVRIAWPEKLGRTAFRQFERMAINIPCELRIEGGGKLEGRLRDLSLGGCGLEFTEFVEIGSIGHLSFSLPDGSHIKGMEAVCRSSQKTGREYATGFQFSPEQEFLESDIAFYIRSTLERHAEAEAPQERKTVLVIDADEESCARIKRGAARHASDVQLAGSALDGIYKVRSSVPSLVVVRQDLPDLNGIEVCKLLRGNPLTKSLNIFLFGGGQPAVEDEVRKLGIEQYFPEGERMLPNLLYAIGNALSKMPG